MGECIARLMQTGIHAWRSSDRGGKSPIFLKLFWSENIYYRTVSQYRRRVCRELRWLNEMCARLQMPFAIIDE